MFCSLSRHVFHWEDSLYKDWEIFLEEISEIAFSRHFKQQHKGIQKPSLELSYRKRGVLENVANSQENTHTRVSFLTKLPALGRGTDIFLRILRNF